MGCRGSRAGRRCCGPSRRLGSLHQTIENPRAYLFRAATNLWIDTLRRPGYGGDALAAHAGPAGAIDAAPGALHDAGATVLQRLAPQERAAVVLKDVFEMSLEEIGDVLGTTIGAVKAAIHRGGSRLSEPEGEARVAPPGSLGRARRSLRRGLQRAGSRGPAESDARHRFRRERRLRRAGRPRGVQRARTAGSTPPCTVIRSGRNGSSTSRRACSARSAAASPWRSASPRVRARKRSSR